MSATGAVSDGNLRAHRHLREPDTWAPTAPIRGQTWVFVPIAYSRCTRHMRRGGCVPALLSPRHAATAPAVMQLGVALMTQAPTPSLRRRPPCCRAGDACRRAPRRHRSVLIGPSSRRVLTLIRTRMGAGRRWSRAGNASGGGPGLLGAVSGRRPGTMTLLKQRKPARPVCSQPSRVSETQTWR
jgi:hypothetical protein